MTNSIANCLQILVALAWSSAAKLFNSSPPNKVRPYVKHFTKLRIVKFKLLTKYVLLRTLSFRSLLMNYKDASEKFAINTTLLCIDLYMRYVVRGTTGTGDSCSLVLGSEMNNASKLQTKQS